MEQYLSDIPYFLFFVFLGIVVNFLFPTKQDTNKLTKKRAAREFIGAIWISLIIYATLVEFFDFSKLFVFIACSIAGYGNSKLIDFFQKDFFEFIIVQGKQAVKNLVGRLKSKSSESDYPPYHHHGYPEEINNEENENR